MIGVPSHVLRFWEKKFSSINPKKNLNGRRFYSSDDIQTLLMIKKLLYDDGFTIKGAIGVIDKKNELNYENINDEIIKKITKSIDLMQHGLNLIKKNIN